MIGVKIPTVSRQAPCLTALPPAPKELQGCNAGMYVNGSILMNFAAALNETVNA